MILKYLKMLKIGKLPLVDQTEIEKCVIMSDFENRIPIIKLDRFWALKDTRYLIHVFVTSRKYYIGFKQYIPSDVRLITATYATILAYVNPSTSSQRVGN